MTVADAQARHAHILDAGDDETGDQMWARAGRFTNNVCYDVRAEYALITKSGGRTCDGRDCDKIIERLPPYRIYDLVIAAGSIAARPTFAQEHVNGKPADFAEPTPYDEEPALEPPPPTFDYPDEPTTVKAFQARVKQAYEEAGRTFPDPNDADAFRHFVRFGYSCHEMPEPQAADKHIGELREDLGL